MIDLKIDFFIQKNRALFFRSITELQFMGYIKPTSRKLDHVVKLTNGSSLLALDGDTHHTNSI